MPVIYEIAPYEIEYYKWTLFFYHDNNYVVYFKQTYNLDYVAFEIFEKNLKLHQILKLKVTGIDNHYNVKIVLSPSGRYFFYTEIDLIEDELENKEISIGKIVELVIDAHTKIFSFALRREIKDFEERYNFVARSFNRRGCSVEAKFFLTDQMELMLYDCRNKRLMYEDNN